MTSFRKAGIEDIPLIRSMAEISFLHTYKGINPDEQNLWMLEWMYSPESLRNQMDSGHEFFLCITEEGSYAGYVSIEPKEEDGLWELQKIYLLPEMQKKGYGRKMFEFACEKVRERGGKKMFLHVNRMNPSVSFYRTMGMDVSKSEDVEIHPGFWRYDYIMTKSIASGR
ncbi:MAG: GNAT family N-acetyltransferase [Bacteroidales bacterium]|nr:GNAT family N-acetyltransferase [Bacteroidales bacterium]